MAALKQLNRMDTVDVDELKKWLALRQLGCGGLNGRPEKTEDVCYSWWVLSSLAIIDGLDCISSGALEQFILKCQVPLHARAPCTN